MYFTPDGHSMSLRKVLEAEIRNYEQGEPSKKARVTPAGRKVASTVKIIDTKHTASEMAAMGGTADTVPVLRQKQSKYVVKVTFDARQISKTKAQTEVMLLLIPEGEEGQLYCQSALRIRTVLVYTGKDGKEQLQANLDKVMEEIEDVRNRGLRYCAKADTFVGQNPDAPLESGDRKVEVEFFVPRARTSVSSATEGGGILPSASARTASAGWTSGTRFSSSFGSRHALLSGMLPRPTA